jgi:DNA polymerase III delta prime subunit
MPAIQSRCQVFEVIPNSKKDEMVRLAQILTKEDVSFKPEDVAFIVNQYHPDMRSIIQYAQQCSISGELIIVEDNLIEADVKSKLIELIKSRKKGAFNDIRQMISDAGVNDYSDLYTYLYEATGQYAAGKEPMAVILIADALHQSGIVIPKPQAQEIVFMSLINKLLQM